MTEYKIYYKDSFHETKSILYECDSIYYAERMGKFMFEKNYLFVEVVAKVSDEPADKNVGEEIHQPFFVWENDYDD